MVTLDAVEDEVVLPALVQLVDLLRHLLGAGLHAVHPVRQLVPLRGQLRERRLLLELLEQGFQKPKESKWRKVPFVSRTRFRPFRPTTELQQIFRERARAYFLVKFLSANMAFCDKN